jgi:CheY-like chemotaxis protein
VDNDAEVLAGMRELLTGWGFAVDAARDVDAALAAAARARPDVVLLDFHLDDGATGLAAHAALVAAHGPLPAAVITADHGEQVRHAVLAAGLVLLHKPIKPLALKSVLARLR